MASIILAENILIGSALTADTTAAGYDAANLIDYRAYTKWKADNSSTVHITAVMGAGGSLLLDDGGKLLLDDGGKLLLGSSSSGIADAVGIFNHNLGTIGAKIAVQYFDNITWKNLVVITPADDAPILKLFTQTEAGRFRLTIYDHTAPPEIAVIFLGRRLDFPTAPESPVIPVSESIKVVSEESETGHLLGTVISHYPLKSNPRWTYVSRAWYSDSFLPFWLTYARKMYPFFYAWDLTNRPGDIFYMTVDPSYVREEPLSILGYVNEVSLMLKGTSL